MTQIVNPSIDRVADSFLTAGSLAYAGLKEGGIVPSGQQTELAEQSAADETVLNGFAFSTSGLDVTVSAGEAFVFGSWIIKDTQTTVTLPASSTTKVYVGWNKDSANSVIIGRDSDFDDEDAKIEVGEFTTDSSTVTSETDLREFVSIDAERLEGKDTSEITPDVSDNGATVVENVDDINVEGFQAFEAFLVDGGATIVGPAQYTDSDAIDAVNNESSLSVNISGDANSVDGFSFVKDGNSGPGIINYQTGIEASGGTTVIDRTIGGVDYRIHAFESVGSSTFSVNQASVGATVDVLVVGGGGAGGNQNAGGGGAGGLVFDSGRSISSGSYSVTVGDGNSNPTRGAGSVSSSVFDETYKGGDSEVFGLQAIGGGNGSGDDYYGFQGGSGGGGADDDSSGGPGQALQPGTNSGVNLDEGKDGGDGRTGGNGEAGAGGGGASQQGFDNSGSNERDGGDGIDMSDEFTSSFGDNGYFAGGGGGALKSNGDSSGTPGIGGLGGGADGAGVNQSGTDAQSNTGGGGGGASSDGSNDGGSGGSGIVLIRYEI